MLEIKDGKLVGTCEVPVEFASLETMIRYGGMDFSQFTNREISEMAGVSTSNARHTMYACGVRAKTDSDAYKRNGGRKERSKTRPIVILESDKIETKRLKQLFLANNDTMASLAQGVGATPTTVNNWFHRGMIPSWKYMHLIAERYHTTVEYLAGGKSSRVLRRY